MTEDPYVYRDVCLTRSLVTQGFIQILLGGGMRENQALSTILSNMLKDPPVSQDVE